MATTKPRITVTLTQRQHDVLRAISEFGGKPMSGFLGEMLEAALPTLERMAVTFQKIKEAQDKERARFIEGLDDAQSALEPYVMDAIGQFDLFLGRVESAVGVGEGDPARGDSSPTTRRATPVTNRGVTPTQGKGRKSAPGKASSRFSTPRSSSKKSGV